MEEIVEEPDFVLDGEHFGRGNYYFDKVTKQAITFKTIKLTRWRIVNENLNQIPDEDYNLFYDTQSYIVQWKYLKEIQDIKNKSEGTLYFHWKGSKSPSGYSPLPEEINQDNVPVERIVQWSEPPVFLQLFNGKMTVRSGTNWDIPSLFIVRGEITEEVHYIEVPCKMDSFRSKTSFILVNRTSRIILVWHGFLSSTNQKVAASKFLNIIKGETDSCSVIEESEGFKISNVCPNVLLGSDNNYFSCNSVEYLQDNYKISPKLFYFTTINGKALHVEIKNPLRSKFVSPFPFLQSHLYSATQPALFLYIDRSKSWIWKGWQHDGVINDNIESEFEDLKQLALKHQFKFLCSSRIQIVDAGLEPLEFTNLFPYWERKVEIEKLQMHVPRDQFLTLSSPDFVN